MKRLILTASLAIVAAVIAPVASASAAEYEFTGSCTITGTASFGGAHLPKLATEKKELPYTFTSGAIAKVGNGTECSGTSRNKETGAEEVAEKRKAKAEVSGKGNLSCAQSESVGVGSGALEVEKPVGSGLFVKASFTGFKFVGLGTEVNFTVEAGGLIVASGKASFAADQGAVSQCGNPGSPGPESLEFIATTSGKIG